MMNKKTMTSQETIILNKLVALKQSANIWETKFNDFNLLE